MRLPAVDPRLAPPETRVAYTFEITNEQSIGVPTRKARELVARGVVGLVLVASLTGCRKPGRQPRVDAGDAGDASLPRDASVASFAPAPDASPPPESPLPWGTRPPPSADLYPALDGPCGTPSVFATLDATFVQVGPLSFGRATPSGLDFDVLDGFAAMFGPDDNTWIANVSGRVDDLWVQMDAGGRVIHETRVLRRRGSKWSFVAPIGKENVHYEAGEPWRGGSLLLATTIAHNEPEAVHLLGVDLPKGTAVAKLVPSSDYLIELFALADDELLVSARRGATPVLYLLAADGSRRSIDAPKTEPYFTFHGHSRASFRAVSGDRTYHLEGDRLVLLEVEDAAPWRRNGRTVQRLVGAGYRDVELPPLPHTSAPAEVESLTIGSDGEAFVVATWKAKPGTTGRALFRSHRPVETVRCPGTDGTGLPSTTTGVEPWPPALTPACATPFVVLFRFGGKERVPKAFPKAAASLGLTAAELVSVDSGGRRVVGVRRASVAEAERIADRAKTELHLDVELVCANPP